MEALSILVLVLLMAVGYSGGAVGRAGPRFELKPSIMDVLLVPALWAGALVSRAVSDVNRWVLILVWVLLSALVGWMTVVLRGLPSRKDSAAEEPEVSDRAVRGLWARWKGFSRRMGSFQSRVLLSLLFFLVAAPFALGVKIFGDPLQIKFRPGASYWLTRKEAPADVEEYRRQF